MGFLSPWFLAALAAVGLPVWLHLLKKHRSVPLPFSSLMFFEQRTQSSIKHRRLRYLLLFALRTALLVLLVLAFAQPFLTSRALPVGGSGKLVILAVDDSFSMRHGGRLERAKREALETIAGLQDRAQVLAFSSHARLMSQPTHDRAALRSAIQSVEPTDSRSSYGELARLLRSIAESARQPLEVHLFSDVQKTSLPAAFHDLRLPENTRLVVHRAADRREPNWVVENVHAPRRITDPKRARVQATVAGLGAERARRRVSLVVAGRVLETQDVEIPANGRAAAEFSGLDAPYGLSACEVRLEPADALPQDDRFYFSVERADPRPVLFVHEARDTRSPLYFRTALEAASEAVFRLDTLTPDKTAGLNPSKFAFVVLSDAGSLPDTFEQALRNYVRGGGSVLVALGPVTAARRRVPVFDTSVVETRYSARDADRFQTAGALDLAHASIRRANRWEGVKFYQVVRVDSGGARVLARLTDETPVLLERPSGAGKILVFASTFDNISNDFPLRAAFVPFIEQTGYYLAGLEDRPSNYQVDSYLELRTARERGTAIEVLDRDGRRVLSLAEATGAQNLRLEREGFYEVRRANGRNELVGVNADRRESDLEIIPAETLALWQNTGQGTAAQAANPQAEDRRQSLWWYVLAAGLLIALAESVVGNRHLAAEKREAA